MKVCATQHPNGEWSAIDQDAYEAECDSIGWFSTCLMGWGKTREEAISDLIDRIEQRAEMRRDALLGY